MSKRDMHCNHKMPHKGAKRSIIFMIATLDGFGRPKCSGMCELKFKGRICNSIHWCSAALMFLHASAQQKFCKVPSDIQNVMHWPHKRFLWLSEFRARSACAWAIRGQFGWALSRSFAKWLVHTESQTIYVDATKICACWPITFTCLGRINRLTKRRIRTQADSKPLNFCMTFCTDPGQAGISMPKCSCLLVVALPGWIAKLLDQEDMRGPHPLDLSTYIDCRSPCRCCNWHIQFVSGTSVMFLIFCCWFLHVFTFHTTS